MFVDIVPDAWMFLLLTIPPVSIATLDGNGDGSTLGIPIPNNPNLVGLPMWAAMATYELGQHWHASSNTEMVTFSWVHPRSRENLAFHPGKRGRRVSPPLARRYLPSRPRAEANGRTRDAPTSSADPNPGHEEASQSAAAGIPTAGGAKSRFHDGTCSSSLTEPPTGEKPANP